MKLRQVLAVGAASALLTPALGVFAAVPAHAARGDIATLEIDAPEVVGVNATPIEFDAEITNAGGLEHENARLFLSFELSEFFEDENGEIDPSSLRVEFEDEDGEWSPIPLTTEGDRVVGSPDRRVLTEAADETLTLRVSVAFDAAALRRAKASALKGGEDAISRARTLRQDAAAPKAAAAPAECSLTDPGFTLDSELRDLDQSGEPVGEPIATDTDEVLIGGAMVAFEGLAGSQIVVGATPKAFTLHLCNSSDSGYDRVRPALFLLRGGVDEPSGRLDLADVVLEQRQGNAWAPVPLSQDEGSDAVVADLGAGGPLAARQQTARQLRLGFKRNAEPGKAAAVAVAELPDTGQQVGVAFADYAIVPVPPQQPPPGGGQGRPAPPDELPDTGGNVSVAMLGAGLLVAGVGAVTAARRRRKPNR
jgi:LPXTG-motif cell wall-anchored protein